jgi:hypothetical protein
LNAVVEDFPFLLIHLPFYSGTTSFKLQRALFITKSVLCSTHFFVLSKKIGRRRRKKLMIAMEWNGEKFAVGILSSFFLFFYTHSRPVNMEVLEWQKL